MTWDGRKRDLGWVAITPTASFAGTLRYKLLAGAVWVQVDGAATTSSGTVLTIAAAGAIPAAYRPAVQARGGGYFAGFPGVMSVGTDGSITVLQQSGADRASVSSTISYPQG